MQKFDSLPTDIKNTRPFMTSNGSIPKQYYDLKFQDFLAKKRKKAIDTPKERCYTTLCDTGEINDNASSTPEPEPIRQEEVKEEVVQRRKKTRK